MWSIVAAKRSTSTPLTVFVICMVLSSLRTGVLPHQISSGDSAAVRPVVLLCTVRPVVLCLSSMTSGNGGQHVGAQRQTRADGERTRAAILRTAASRATVEGLEGLSIGNLAGATGISKSG